MNNKERLNIVTLLLLGLAFISGCTQYKYRPYHDYNLNCYKNDGDFAGEIVDDCHESPVFTDYTKLHEMSPTEKRFLPKPSDSF